MMHDWLLDSIVVNWRTAKARLSVTNRESEQLEILVDGIATLTVEHLEPWGRSDSINDVSRSVDDEKVTLTISMQSGDVIVVAAREVDLPARGATK